MYCLIPNSTIESCEIEFEKAKSLIYIFGFLKNVDVVCIATENKKKNNWSMSLRSRTTSVNKFAERFDGGGHKYASGIKAENKNEVLKIIKELIKYAKNSKAKFMN